MVDIRRSRHGWHVRAYYLEGDGDLDVKEARLLAGDDAMRVRLDDKRPVWARQVLFNWKRQELIEI